MLVALLVSACGPAIATQSSPPDSASKVTLAAESIVTTTAAVESTVPATTTTTVPPTAELRLELIATIHGDIAPKSVVASGAGLFFAQNMMYRHTITVYDSAGQLVATIPDEVDLVAHGHSAAEGVYRGAPVEAAFTSDGSFAYVTNYQMYGPGYGSAGSDDCGDSGWDGSFVYRIDTTTLQIDQVIGVGAVPKYVAVTPDDSRVLVTNWCSFDMSVIDANLGSEVARVDLRRHPRGIAVAPDGSVAYVAVMGGRDIAVVSMNDLSVEWIEDVGANPRHLVISPDGAFLYATLNGSGRVIKIGTASREVAAEVTTGTAPRSMAISPAGDSLYVVNYESNSVSKVLTATMEEVQELATGHHPIGITYDAQTGHVWVSNYSGSLMIFADRAVP